MPPELASYRLEDRVQKVDHGRVLDVFFVLTVNEISIPSTLLCGSRSKQRCRNTKTKVHRPPSPSR